jgi:hypothetical protein
LLSVAVLDTHRICLSNLDRQLASYCQLATTMDAAANSFTARRPAAGGLPQFHLPPPNPPLDIHAPRVTGSDGLSPLSSGVNSGSSQGSQAGIAPYNPSGSWPLPGSSSYTYSSANQTAQSGIMPSAFGRPMYSPSGGSFNRSTQSPATAETLAAPPYDAISPTFPQPMSGGGPGGSSMPHSLHNLTLSSQGGASHPPTPSTTAPSDNYSRTPGYYAPPPSSTPQQQSFPSFAPAHPSPTQQSPTTTGPMSRGIPALNSQQHSPMQAPPHYTHRSYGYQVPTGMGGAVLSNMANPGGQMTIVGGMHTGHHGYPTHHLGPHPSMYHHGQPSPQQDRPFKCDVCVQAFNRNHDLKRHKRIHLSVKPFPCGHCDKSFSRKDALKRHRLVKGCGNGQTSPIDGNGQDDGKAEMNGTSSQGES